MKAYWTRPALKSYWTPVVLGWLLLCLSYPTSDAPAFALWVAGMACFAVAAVWGLLCWLGGRR